MAVAVKSGQTAQVFSGDATTSLSVSLPGAPTSGNLLVYIMAGDKNTGDLTLSGFTQVYSMPQTSVSLYFCYKISDGSETTINPSWANSAVSGNVCWYAELEDTGVAGSNWQIAGQASNISDNSTVNSWSTGTTGTLTADALAVAVVAIDSGDAQTDQAMTNSFSLLTDITFGDPSAATPAVGTKSVTSGTTAETSFSYTGTADQLTGAIVAFYKAAAGGTVVPNSMLLGVG